MQITLFLQREPSGRALKLNLPFKKPFSLSISAQGDLFLLAINNATGAFPPDFPNYGVSQRVITRMCQVEKRFTNCNGCSKQILPWSSAFIFSSVLITSNLGASSEPGRHLTHISFSIHDS